MKAEKHNIEATLADDVSSFVEEVEPSYLHNNETERLRKHLASEREQFLRLAAEFDNYRRRVKQERAETAETGKRELLLQLISFADDFERALKNLGTDADLVADGLHMISRRFTDVLCSNGVIPFESIGEKFDPERHEALDVVVTGENDSGTVQSEFRRGYFWNDKLLRPALVIVEK